VPHQQVRESHTFFATPFCVADSRAFSRNRALGGASERNAGRLTAEFERISGRVCAIGV